MQYELMNKNRALAILEINKNFTGIVKILDNIPYYIGDIPAWISNRTTPIGRANIEYLLKLAGIRNKEEYLSVTHGISMTDTFWFRQIGDNITWEKISPYRNRFSRVISEICLNGDYKYNGELRSPSPDYKIDGSVDKCWKHINGDTYLFKTAGECFTGLAGLRPYMEYYASQVADCLIDNKNHFVKYGITVGLTKNGFRKPYVYCRAITDEQRGLLAYCDSKYNKISLDELDKHYLNYESRKILREMIVLDSIILNCDRHDGNYGFIVDNDTYNILGLAPIYDNDCSLGFSVSLQNVDSNEEGYREALKRQARAGLGDYIEQARWAMTKDLFQKLLSMRGFKFKRLKTNIDVADDRIEFMEYIVNRQIEAITNTYRKR